jgi:hypothetical protein
MVDTHFRDAFTYRLAIPETAQRGLRQPVQYPRPGLDLSTYSANRKRRMTE